MFIQEIIKLLYINLFFSYSIDIVTGRHNQISVASHLHATKDIRCYAKLRRSSTQKFLFF